MEVYLQIILDGGDEIRISEPDSDNLIHLDISEEGSTAYTTLYLNFEELGKIRQWINEQFYDMEKTEKERINNQENG